MSCGYDKPRLFETVDPEVSTAFLTFASPSRGAAASS